MAYFSHAFQKLMIGVPSAGAITLPNGTMTSSLTAGKLAIVDAKSHETVAAPAIATNPLVYLAQGSFATLDKLGPFHGGYKESVKSKGINPKYVSRFFKECSRAAQNQVIAVGYDGSSDATVPTFECGKNYFLRIDVKGSPALRFLSHNIYRTFDAFSGCCADNCSAGCTGEAVDPLCVLIEWAKRINNDPLLKSFVAATVANDGTPVDLDTYVCATDPGDIAGIKGTLILTGAYMDTTFGNCSFEPMDHVELMPIKILASLTNSDGQVCDWKGITVTETQEGLQATGIGETVIREYILSQAYGTNLDYKRDPRLREVLDGNTIFTAVDRAGSYDRYSILHNVPRFNNPSSTFDNDQYLITIAVPAGTDMSAFVTAFENYLSGAGNPVTLETFGACS